MISRLFLCPFVRVRNKSVNESGLFVFAPHQPMQEQQPTHGAGRLPPDFHSPGSILQKTRKNPKISAGFHGSLHPAAAYSCGA